MKNERHSGAGRRRGIKNVSSQGFFFKKEFKYDTWISREKKNSAELKIPPVSKNSVPAPIPDGNQ